MISFEEFEERMHAIEDHDNFCHRVSKFLEDEICKSSWCMVTAGEKLKQILQLKIYAKSLILNTIIVNMETKLNGGYTKMSTRFIMLATKRLMLVR